MWAGWWYRRNSSSKQTASRAGHNKVQGTSNNARAKWIIYYHYLGRCLGNLINFWLIFTRRDISFSPDFIMRQSIIHARRTQLNALHVRHSCDAIDHSHGCVRRWHWRSIPSRRPLSSSLAQKWKFHKTNYIHLGAVGPHRTEFASKTRRQWSVSVRFMGKESFRLFSFAKTLPVTAQRTRLLRSLLMTFSQFISHLAALRRAPLLWNFGDCRKPHIKPD